MRSKTITSLLILSAVTIAGANSAVADGSVYGRSPYGTRPTLIVGGFVGLDGYGGYGSGGGYGNRAFPGGYGDWYGICSGHDDCPLFRKRVPKPDGGWQVQMV